MNWTRNISVLTKCLNSLAVKDLNGKRMEADAAFSRWTERIVRIRQDDGSVYFIGNGASASIASHMAADLGKNAMVRTEVLTDPALITALGNDCGYEEVFVEPLRWRMRAEDMLIAISSSGNSPNILSAVKYATSLRAYVVTLSAMKPDNPLRYYGNLRFYVPALSYGASETSHAAILHHWVDKAIESVATNFLTPKANKNVRISMG